jgi:tRNA A-37 threonylcarbamoyl transferase component Bud32
MVLNDRPIKREHRMIPGSMQGQVLGKYQILDPLGRGGMAQVYRAYHPQLDRYVAVKVLRSDLVDDKSFLSRFQREARAIAALRHPHIVQVHDFDVHQGVYYMVMELLEGDTLKTRLHDYRISGERMPLGEVVRILLDVLEGLAYAHGEGMVHRDIKPGNILLTRRGEAVLADFGIAQIVGGTRHTASGALMGTLSYIAPEQGLEGQSDARSDIYSLGIVLYEALTCRTPFEADTPLAILMKHLNDPLPRPSQVVSDIPEPLERVVLEALAKRPEDRYQSAAEMGLALHQAVEEAGIDVPARLSLPMSFRTAEAPSEAVAVFSGTTRDRIADAGFAAGETDVRLDEHLKAENAPHSADTARDDVPARLGLGRAIIRAIGLVLVGNMAALTAAALSDRWPMWAAGWPVEFLLVGLGLCVIMHATSCVWLLIPVGILLGNGMLFSYSSLSGNWHHWRFLWPFELWLALSVVMLTLWLARRGDRARGVSRWLGRALGWVAVTWGLLVVAAATVA